MKGPAQTDGFISSTDGRKSSGKISLTEPLLGSNQRSKTEPSAYPDASAALQRIAELEAALEDTKRGEDSFLEAKEAARRLEEVGMDDIVSRLFDKVMTDSHEKRSEGGGGRAFVLLLVLKLEVIYHAVRRGAFVIVSNHINIMAFVIRYDES